MNYLPSLLLAAALLVPISPAIPEPPPPPLTMPEPSETGQVAPQGDDTHAYTPITAEEAHHLFRCLADYAAIELRRINLADPGEAQCRLLKRGPELDASIAPLRAVPQWYRDTNPSQLRLRRAQWEEVRFLDAAGKPLGPRLHNCWELGAGCYYYAAGTLPVSLTELLMTWLPERGSMEAAGCREDPRAEPVGLSFHEQDAAFTERLRAIFAATEDIELRVRYSPMGEEEDFVTSIRGEVLRPLLARFAAVPQWYGVEQRGFVYAPHRLGLCTNVRDVTARFRNAAGEELLCQRLDHSRRWGSLAWLEKQQEDTHASFLLDVLLDFLPESWARSAKRIEELDALWEEALPESWGGNGAE